MDMHFLLKKTLMSVQRKVILKKDGEFCQEDLESHQSALKVWSIFMKNDFHTNKHTMLK